MARTIQEIYDSIIEEKEGFASLNGLLPNNDTASSLLEELSSQSRVAMWRLFVWIVAVSHWSQEKVWDLMKIELTEIAARSVYGTKQWFVGKALEYQDGYSVVIDDNYNPIYQEIDEESKIIKYASIQNVGNVAVIKVAKESSGSPLPLSSEELLRFRGYIDDIQPAGTAIAVESKASDQLKIVGTVYYDANLNLSTIESRVNNAINRYLNEIDFNGVVVKNALIDYIQEVIGVRDITISSIAGKAIGKDYTVFSRTYQTEAGHIKLDTVNTSISYQPE